MWWVLGVNAVLLLVVGCYFVLRRRRGQAIVALLLGALICCQAEAFGNSSERSGGGRFARDIVGASNTIDDPTVADTSHAQWSWRPPWRNQGDCGPSALFVLLRLKNKDVTLDDVTKRVPVDSTLGCSMLALREAADAVGLPSEVRFVKPEALSKLTFPYILHGQLGLKAKTGHFLVIVGRNPTTGSYAVVDPVYDQFGWWTEKATLSGYSGYVLIPTESSLKSHQELAACVASALTFAGCVLAVRKAVK